MNVGTRAVSGWVQNSELKTNHQDTKAQTHELKKYVSNVSL